MYMNALDEVTLAKARDRWSGLTEADLRSVGNDSEQLVDLVSRKRGIDRARAQTEVEEFLDACGCSRSPDDPSRARHDKRDQCDRTTQQGVSGRADAGPVAPTPGRGPAAPQGVKSSSNKPGTSTDDLTGEMASAGPGRRTRPDDDAP